MGRKGEDTALVCSKTVRQNEGALNFSSRLIELNGMKASDEITEEQSRQASPGNTGNEAVLSHTSLFTDVIRHRERVQRIFPFTQLE